MSTSARCSHCDAPLPAGNAVCPACEALFDKGPWGSVANEGPHSCPHCLGRFNQPAALKLPSSARWYQPQSPRPACPHCEAQLKDQKLSDSSTGAIFFIIFGLHIAAAPFFVTASLLAIAGVFLIRDCLALYRRQRNLPTAHRYTLYRLPNKSN